MLIFVFQDVKSCSRLFYEEAGLQEIYSRPLSAHANIGKDGGELSVF